MNRLFPKHNLPFISIRWKLVSLCVAMVTVPVVILGLLSYNTLRMQAYENIEADLQIIVSDWKKIIESYIEQKKRILKREEILVQQRLISVAEDVALMLDVFNQEYGNTPTSEQKNNLFDHIANIKLGRSGYVSLINYNGTYLLSKERKEDGQNLFTMDETKASFMRNALRLFKSDVGRDHHLMQYVWSHGEDSLPRMKMTALRFYEPWKLFILVNIYHTDFKSYSIEGQFKREIRRKIANQRIGKSGYIWGLNSAGEYVVSKDLLRDGEDVSQVQDEKGTYIVQDILAIAQRLKQGDTAVYYYSWQNLDDQRPYNKLSAITYIPEWDWILGASAYHKDFLSGLKTIQRDIVKVCLSAIVLGSLLAYILASMLLQPVLRLQKLALQISKGDLNVDINPGIASSNDEIGDLAQAFSAMMININKLVKQQKETNVTLSLAKEEAEAANIAKSDFLARMSHEIRTPLNAVTGLTTVVLKSELTPKQRDYLHKVQLAGNNLLGVINDILDFSKVEAGQLELSHAPFNLDQVLENLAELFSNRVASKDLELIFAIDPKTPRHLRGDAGRLTQVLTNLIENSVKFTDNGEVLVKVEPLESAVPKPEKLPLLFQVTDSGCGIDTDILPTLFEPFTQADIYLTRKHEGAGLGLAICRRLVELMGGTIWAESVLGSGSNFYFTVTVEPLKDISAQHTLPPELHGLKTLVVDDSESARQVLRELLESFTFKVSEANCGEKAMELVSQAMDEPFHLILLDWKMPGIDGVETARRIQAMIRKGQGGSDRQPVTPIIIMVTAYGHEFIEEHHNITALGPLLLKPINSSRLFNTVMELFSLSQPVQQEQKLFGDSGLHLPDTIEGSKVLIVEDSVLNREVAIALLQALNLEVDTAENGQTAVEKVSRQSEGDQYDLVFMDIQMPVMDGYQATKLIRQWEKQQAPRQRPLRIIALTAHALMGEKEMCLNAEMDDYLSKPIDEQELHRLILKWLVKEGEGLSHGKTQQTRDH